MDKEFLETIAKNTGPKSSFQIVISDNKTQIKTRFNPPIQLDKTKKYEIALVNLETYYSFPNITSENNYFRYSANRKVNWTSFRIPTGSYDIVDLNEFIHERLRRSGHSGASIEESNIIISANANTLKSRMEIRDNFAVDFIHPKSIGKVLGFDRKEYNPGIHESENVVDILSINSILVNIDIISGSYVNGSSQNTIYSFFPNVSPGYKIVETPHNLVYLPITLDTIRSLETKLTDQNGNLLNLRGENVTIRFHIREI